LTTIKESVAYIMIKRYNSLKTYKGERYILWYAENAGVPIV
jgi:hypothetical protein